MCSVAPAMRHSLSGTLREMAKHQSKGSRVWVQLKLVQMMSIQYKTTFSAESPTNLMFSVSTRLSLGEWSSTVPIQLTDLLFV
jgi:hypothetical protein